MPFKDLRDFLGCLESQGQLARIAKQVDWNQEIGHVAKLNEQKSGPALLFENIKDYPGQSVLTSLLTTKERVALALDIPPQTSLLDISRAWVDRIQDVRIPPREVDEAPCHENIMLGDDVDLYKLATPWYYPKDGGRYVGTASFLLSRNLDTGRINLGTYRVQILDKNNAGIQLIKGKDSEIDLRGYAAAGNKPMPVALVIGADPVLFLVGSTLFPLTESEYDVAGALRGQPIDIVRGKTVDLPIPATAEIVIEGEIVPGELRDEGPFGEYTGYYSGKGVVKREFIKVKAITHRTNPILWGTTVGKPVTDTHMVMGINRTASLWNDLKAMKIPGIKAVFSPPASAGRFLAIISVEQMYPAHGMQVGLAAFASVTGNYGLKTVIVVDHDIDPENMDQVMYALSFRYQPGRGTQIIRRGRSTPLDPSLEIAQRDVTSRIVIDATIPWEWKEKPIPIELDPALAKQIEAHWADYFPQNGR